MRPGSLPWLLRHDLRIGWRDFRSGFGRLGAPSLVALAAVVLAGMHALVWSLAEALADSGAPGEAQAAALPFVAFVLLLLLSQTLAGSAKLLYGRGDLDLLLSSPAAPARVLGARALAVALGALASAAVFVLPVADDALMLGHPRLLAIYPALAAGALLAAALGLAATLALLRLLGPRRTRLAAQILATVVGAGFVLGLQAKRLVPGLLPDTLLDEGGRLRAALLLPVRAGLGEPGPLAAWMLLGTGAFALAALALGPAFARGAVAAADVTATEGAATPARRGERRSAGGFPRGPLQALRRKEWRLVARDPWVVSQILMQVLYMAPLAVLLWTGSRDPALALAPTLVVVTFQVSSSLTWLGLSGEDAPDLLASAPVPPGLARRGKLQAVGALALALVALPLAWLAVAAPPAALLAAAFGALALAAALALQLWHGAPARRSRFAARHRESKIVGLLEAVLSILFGLATALGVMGEPWAAAPLLLVGALMLWLRPRHPRRTDADGR